MKYEPIENHGIVGDLRTVALVGKDGSIDFFCAPEFDSPSMFAGLLHPGDGGHFRIAPLLENVRHKQLYLPDTCVLLTRFLSEEGVAEVSDFMPVESNGFNQAIVRRAKCVRGEVKFRVTCRPRFDYGRSGHAARPFDGGVEFVPQGPGLAGLRLRWYEQPLGVRQGDAEGEFTLCAGESASFVLETIEGEDMDAFERREGVAASFKTTANFWRHWVSKCTYHGRWREEVIRSALTLKLLVSRKYGTIVASPTFGLPELVGGERNWDYRYTWIRDASFTLYALIRLGYTEEAAAFMKWLAARCADFSDDVPLQVMYGIDGRGHLPEEVLEHFDGYMGSRPVRIGNGAAHQLQLDIYGELMDSVYLFNKFGTPISHDLWMNLVRLVDWVCENWEQPDEGIWEVRGGQHEFLYSRLLCWVAVDRGLRLADRRSFPAPRDRWQKVRDAIYKDIYANFWSEKLQSFVQFKGGESLDASTLLMPLVRFISPTDPRWKSTLRAIEKHLMDDSLVYRYIQSEHFTDGLHGGEGTFCMCSFWYVENLSRSGDLDKARFYFEKMLGYSNHLGLFAEELGPAGEHLGNFPQAFTHIALISAAYDLDRRLSARGAKEQMEH